MGRPTIRYEQGFEDAPAIEQPFYTAAASTDKAPVVDVVPALVVRTEQNG